ncbi:MAG: DNA repair protein RadC, partial [Bacilli bacterium]
MEKGLMVRDVPLEERPRERMMNMGAEYLTNADLLAILLRTGSHTESVMNLANRVLAKVENFRNLADISVEELVTIKGIGPAKAIQIRAGIELGRRLSRLQPEDRMTIRSPQDAADLLMEEMKYLTKEYFVVLFLNTKSHVIGKETISVG